MINDAILKRFPKKRIELPPNYKRIYKQHYLSNREGKYKTTSLSQKLESWMHRKVAEDISRTNKKLSTLEIGAGTLNHIRYETIQNTYDIVEPFSELYEGSPRLKNIRNIYHDIDDVKNEKYDRIISIATFEHMIDLPWVISKAALLLNENGSFRIAIPNEGTIMWKLGTLVTGYEFRKKHGLDYQLLMQYEHVNTAKEIEEVLKYFFEKTDWSVFGLNKSLAFYRFYSCREPDIERVINYLESQIKLDVLN